MQHLEGVSDKIAFMVSWLAMLLFSSYDSQQPGLVAEPVYTCGEHPFSSAVKEST